MRGIFIEESGGNIFGDYRRRIFLEIFVNGSEVCKRKKFRSSTGCGTGDRRGQEEAEGAEKHFHQIAEGISYRQKEESQVFV